MLSVDGAGAPACVDETHTIMMQRHNIMTHDDSMHTCLFKKTGILSSCVMMLKRSSCSVQLRPATAFIQRISQWQPTTMIVCLSSTQPLLCVMPVKKKTRTENLYYMLWSGVLHQVIRVLFGRASCIMIIIKSWMSIIQSRQIMNHR